MSDHFLVVIPADPGATLPATATALRNALSDMAATDEARVKDYGKLQFIDCGENAERILCPACGSVIPVEHWHAWMEEDWHGEDGFHLHSHTTPCCANEATLNTLVYEWPQGFARWFVSARTDTRGTLTAEEVSRLEIVAGLPLKAIAQMY